MDTPNWILLGAAAVTIAACFFLLPTFIAFKRDHSFKWVIFAINVVLGASGLGWLIAFVWAVYPQEKSLADPLIGNPTGIGTRNAGHTLGEVAAGNAQSHGRPVDRSNSESALNALNGLAVLAEKGVISSEEFAQKKAELLSQV